LAGATESVFAIRRLISAAQARGLVLDEGMTAREPVFYARLSVAHAQQLRERAVHELGAALPLVVAAGTEESHCLIHFAVMSCRTMAEVVQLIVAHWRYVTEAFGAHAVRRDGAVHLELDVPPAAPLGMRVGVEYLLASLVRACREITGGAWQPRALVLGHRPPVALGAWEAVCGVPVEIGETPGLVIAEDSLVQPVQSRMSAGAGQFFRELLAWCTPRPPPTLAERVAGALARDLAVAAPTVEQVAAELGLSARSLHRQLAVEGTSYQRVLDGLRRDRAVQAVDAGDPFKAIAAAVGFADPRAFRRAFKRWTGATPQQFRGRGEPARELPGGGSWQPWDPGLPLAGLADGPPDGDAQDEPCADDACVEQARVEIEQLLRSLDRR
ncbi:MAG TPA: helix-turn-helix domain-containing protein, partial [Kofleriaceae bacterium]|nr:helix-turn-helix domain-containing protein [Kofleriaceae bacterium]